MTKPEVDYYGLLELLQNFEKDQPKDMLQVLEDSFGILDDVERHKTSYTIFNVRIRDGASFTDHVLYMIELIEQAQLFLA